MKLILGNLLALVVFCRVLGINKKGRNLGVDEEVCLHELSLSETVSKITWQTSPSC